MLMEVKKELRVIFMSIKYSIMREMLNKISFFSNVIFMILNNATFIIQWVILYSIKDNVGGYSFKEVMLLWGLAAGVYGFSHFFFKKAFELSDIINEGALDTYLIQPKNVLLSVITSDVKVSAIGDIIYSYIMLIVFGFSVKNFILFTIFCILGGLILVSISIILSSLSFWFQKTDVLAESINSIMVNFATYPEGIFKGIIKFMMYTVIPVGLTVYLPLRIITNFNLVLFIILIFSTSLFIFIANLVFNKGLKKYSSSSLMIIRI